MQALTILDLDGTLMPSHEVDNECYWRAVGEVFDRELDTLSLSGFRHVTDSGIFAQWCQEELGREPEEEEFHKVRQRFLELTREATVQHHHCFTPVKGVEDWIGQRDSSTLAIATGGWEATARCKLRASGLDRFSLPLFTADHAMERKAIMIKAFEALQAGNSGLTESLEITYFGDGIWDLKAAQQLGWSFVGIADGDRARALRAAGAERVFDDFTPLLQG